VTDPLPDSGLTRAEDHVVSLLGQAYRLIEHGVCGHGPTRDADLAEMATAIHVVQYRMVAQGAARARPDLYRLMGEEIRQGDGS
jgi:hypothetical protein